MKWTKIGETENGWEYGYISIKAYCSKCLYFSESGSVEFPDAIQECKNERINKRFYYKDTWRKEKDLIKVKDGVHPSILNKNNDCKRYEDNARKKER